MIELEAEPGPISGPARARSLALIVVAAELPLVRSMLASTPDQVVSGIHLLNDPGRASAEPVLEPADRSRTFSRLESFVAGCDADLLIISERRDLIRPEVAFAVIELALRGIPVCSLAHYLAAPDARRAPVPDPGTVVHLLVALAAGQRNRSMKRLVDIVVGGLALLLTLPLFILITVAIRLDSPGPVFFVQERLGRLRTPFACLKFRTMQVDAEQGTGPVWASIDDPRITRVGRFLRRSRLDELPQLINVVRGDMSLVGARPIRRHFADQLAVQVPFYDVRFVEKPGVTGWAQVRHTYSSTFVEQVEKFYYDYYYVRNRSIWLDFYIMLLTAAVIVRMKGT